MTLSKELLDYVKEKYLKKFGSLDNFDEDLKLYMELPTFKANENIHEVFRRMNNETDGEPDIEARFNSLLKSTPGRIVKMWCGNDSEDISELGSGRWNKEPYISAFPNTSDDHAVITKEVDVVSCCSHHFLPFSTFNGGKAIISYIPDKYVLGISKLQRFTNWAAKRFWLQEDLTQYLGRTIARIAQTDDVYIRLEGLVHGCEEFRGASCKNGSLTTEYCSGYFKNKDK